MNPKEVKSGNPEASSLTSVIRNKPDIDFGYKFVDGNVGDEFLLRRTPTQDDFYHLRNGKFCGEAWDAVSRYVYTALQGGSILTIFVNFVFLSTK